MDVVNEAVDWMYYRVPPEKWTFVNVAIAPSTITITEHGVSVVCLVWINVCVCALESCLNLFSVYFAFIVSPSMINASSSGDTQLLLKSIHTLF